MYDQFEPFQILEPKPFHCIPKKYLLWKQAEIVEEKNTSVEFKCHVSNTMINTTEIFIKFSDNSMKHLISVMSYFDMLITLHDRLSFINIPPPSSTDDDVLKNLRAVMGTTNDYAPLKYQHPFACNLFLVNRRINKVSFNISNPPMLLEFFTS